MSMKIVWNNENTSTLIDFYSEHECLWNPKNSDYKIRSKRHLLWAKLADQLGIKSETGVPQFLDKVKTLRDVYRQECRRETEGSTSGSASSSQYKTKWLYFERLHFLKDSMFPDNSFNTMDHNINEYDEEIADEENNENDDTVDEIDLSATTNTLDDSRSGTQARVESKRVPIKTTTSNSKRAKKVKQPEETEKLRQATYTKAMETLSREEDSPELFGKLVAQQLRAMDPYKQQSAQCQIQQLLMVIQFGQQPTRAPVIDIPSSGVFVDSTNLQPQQFTYLTLLVIHRI